FVRGDNTAILALDNPSASVSIPNGNIYTANAAIYNSGYIYTNGPIQSASWIYAAGGLRAPQVQNNKLCRGVGDTVVCDRVSAMSQYCIECCGRDNLGCGAIQCATPGNWTNYTYQPNHHRYEDYCRILIVP
ncbi:MAG: hypothetical protein ACOYK8_10765, partial [Alphaproteobacteria bacterium]